MESSRLSDLKSLPKLTRILIAIVLVGLIVRLVIAVSLTYCTDLSYWVRVSSNITANDGLYDVLGYFYTPVWGYILSFLTGFCDMLGISYGHVDPNLLIPSGITGQGQIVPSVAYTMVLKIFLIAVDMLVAYFIYKIVTILFKDEKTAVLAVALWLLCPLSISISSFRVSFDNIEVLFMLIAIYAALKGNFVISGTSMAISLLTKPYGAFIALGLIIYSYGKNNSFKDTGKYILSAIVTFAILMLPVILNGDFEQSMDWLLGRIRNLDSHIYNMVIPLSPVIIAIFIVIMRKMSKIKDNRDVVLCLSGLLFTAMMLILPGNTQYYLILLALVIIALPKDSIAAIFFISLLGLLSFSIVNISIFGEIGYYDYTFDFLNIVVYKGHSLFGMLYVFFKPIKMSCGIICAILAFSELWRYSYEQPR